MTVNIKVAIWSKVHDKTIEKINVITDQKKINLLTEKYVSDYNETLNVNGDDVRLEVITCQDIFADILIYFQDRLNSKIEYDKYFLKDIIDKIDSIANALEELTE